MMSAIVYLTLGAMLLPMQPSYRLRVYVMAVPVVLTLAVGTSRIYLAVHWPTDVLAGWAAGGAWALLCWLLSARLLKPMRQIGYGESENRDVISPADDKA
jgi:undecaprenyl-diphosphatase